MENKPILIAMMGLPRSGKSTIAKKLALELGAPIVSRDALRLAVHGQRYEPTAEPLVKTLDIYMIRALFLAGHTVVICDETNYSPEARAHLEDPSWDVQWYPVLTDPRICKIRARDTEQEDLLEVIDEMFSRYVRLPSGSKLYPKWQPTPGMHDIINYATNTTVS